MQRLLIAVLAFAAFASPCAAAPFTIKCLDRAQFDVYVTLDPERKQVVYETGGGNFLKEITKAVTPGRAEFVIKQDGLADFAFVWNEAAGLLSWKEVPATGAYPPNSMKCAPTARPTPKFEDIPPLQ